MKVATTLLIAGFLLATASFGADNPAASPETPGLEAASPEITPSPQALPSENLDDEALATPAEGCEAGGDALIAMEWQEPTPAGTQYCGSCSTPNCNGAPRGQLCWTGSGWGHCNIFSGGYMCPTGGWDCQCKGGVLP